MDKIAIIVAAGSGSRMHSDLPKQFLPLAGKAVIVHTLEAFIRADNHIKIILVLPTAQLDYGKQLLQQKPYKSQITLIAGGNTRFQSVANGLQLITSDSIVFVHDGVRCLVTTELINRCYTQALRLGSAIPVCPATDSMRIVEKEGPQLQPSGSRTIDRGAVRLVQTPQVFKSSLLKRAFEQQYLESFTDEASVVEAMGEQVCLVPGDPENIKITRPIDLIIASAILAQRTASQ